MSSTPNTIDNLSGTLNNIYKHDIEDAEEDAEEQFIFSSSDFDDIDEEDIIREKHLKHADDYQFIVIHDTTTDGTHNNILSERILTSTPKVIGGNNVSVVKLNSNDSCDGEQSVDLERFSKAYSLEVSGEQYTNFDENVTNGQCDGGDNEGVFFSDDDEVVINFLGQANHIVRL